MDSAVDMNGDKWSPGRCLGMTLWTCRDVGGDKMGRE